MREPDVRRLSDMRDVIFDRGWLTDAGDRELYYMYRDLYLSRADRESLIAQDLRYDITIIPPNMLGREYVKTVGHYHPPVAGTSETYPELYEVLHGEALYLLQNQDMSDVVAVHAVAGDKVLVPPGYGHVTINRSNQTLKMANLVGRSFVSIYEPYRRNAGAAFFFTNEGWIRNERCERAGELRIREAPDARRLAKLGLHRGREMYPRIREAGALEYLTLPHEHMDAFEGLL